MCRPTLLGSALALVGTLVIAADRSGLPHSNSLHPAAFGASTAHSPEASPLGDALIIFAALCYSAATVRIPAWAVRRAVPPLHLALGKSAFLATVSLAALGAEAAWLGATGRTLAGLWPGWRQAAGWACIGWSALGPGALSAFLHVKVRPFNCCALLLWTPMRMLLQLPLQLGSTPSPPWPHAGAEPRAANDRSNLLLHDSLVFGLHGGRSAARRAPGPPHAAGRLPRGSRRGGGGLAGAPA